MAGPFSSSWERLADGNASFFRREIFVHFLYQDLYAGLIPVRDKIRKGCHPAIIDKSLYDDVRRMLFRRRTFKHKRLPSALPWLLRGLIVCGGCGRPFSTHVAQNGPIAHMFYRCRSTSGGREPCKRAQVRTNVVDEVVLSAIGIEAMELASGELATLVRGLVRQVVYNVRSGEGTIEFQPGAALPLDRPEVARLAKSPTIFFSRVR